MGQAEVAVQDPVVSVVMTTYQHVRWIAQALDSALMQRTDFGVEILVGEDASTDGTREICERYAAEHPDRIRLFRRRRDDVIHIDGRPTGRYNLLTTMAEARGRYVAILEGDDAWTDRDKLQRQVSFLQAHPDHVLSMHPARRVNAATDAPLSVFPRLPEGPVAIEQLLAGTNFVPTCSVVYRRAAIPDPLPPWLWNQSPMADLPLHVLVGLQGRIHLHPQVMGLYRVGAGRWSGANLCRRLEAAITVRELLLPHLEGVQRDLLHTALLRMHLRHARALAREGHADAARAALARGCTDRPGDPETELLALQAKIACRAPTLARAAHHVVQQAREALAPWAR